MNRLFAIGHVIAFILACALIWGVDGFMYKSSAGLSNKNVNPYYDSSVGADADFSKGLPILSKLAELEQEIEEERYNNRYGDNKDTAYLDLPYAGSDLDRSRTTYRPLYDKRADDGTATVVFRCTPKTAKCLNKGRGPRVTLQGKRAFCVCQCPRKLRGPQCTKQRP